MKGTVFSHRGIERCPTLPVQRYTNKPRQVARRVDIVSSPRCGRSYSSLTDFRQQWGRVWRREMKRWTSFRPNDDNYQGRQPSFHRSHPSLQYQNIDQSLVGLFHILRVVRSNHFSIHGRFVSSWQQIHRCWTRTPLVFFLVVATRFHFIRW